MTDPVIIERSEIAAIARNAVSQFIQELKLKNRFNSKWITQNQAQKNIIGRGRLKRAMKSGLIRFYKTDPEKRNSRVMLLRSDLDKFINNTKT